MQILEILKRACAQARPKCACTARFSEKQGSESLVTNIGNEDETILSVHANFENVSSVSQTCLHGPFLQMWGSESLVTKVGNEDKQILRLLTKGKWGYEEKGRN